MSFYTVIGIGDTPVKALLYARVNQIGYNCGIKKNTIAKKTKCLHIDLPDRVIPSELVKKIYMAYHYYQFQKKQRNEFTEGEYNAFKLLIIFYGKELFDQIMTVFADISSETTIAIEEDELHYRFMY